MAKRSSPERAAQREARRVAQREARERIARLRANVREALAAKKRRLKEIQAMCRAHREELRARLRAMRAEGLAVLRADLKAQRDAARAELLRQKKEARATLDSAVAVVRAELAAERQHQAELRRIAREERERLAAHKKPPPQTDAEVRAAVGPFAPLVDKAKRPIRPKKGETRAEAVLAYAAKNPDEAHAHLEPATERRIADAQEQLAAAQAPGKPRRKGQLARTGPGMLLEDLLRERAELRAEREARAGRRAGTSAAGSKAPTPEALRAKIERAYEAMKAARRRRDRLLARFESGNYGNKSRTDVYDELAEAERVFDAKSDAILEAEKAFLDATGFNYWKAPPTEAAAPSAPELTPPQAPVERNAYEEKRAAKAERLRTRAEKKRAEAEAVYQRTHDISSMIPMGQPILVGHHSEKRHRRDLERIRRGYTKQGTLKQEAAALERRAQTIEDNRAVSSDDPEAIPKLREKLAELNAARKQWKAINAVIRMGGDVRARLAALGLSVSEAAKLLEKDFAGRIGIPAYKFTNASAEARRIEERIRVLEQRARETGREERLPGDIRIAEEENRVRVIFPSVPPEATRRALKGAGFRWSPTVGAWQRHASSDAWYQARRIVGGAGAGAT